MGPLAGLAAEQRPAVGAYPLGFVHGGEELGPDGHVARGESAQLRIGEGEAGEEDVDERLLDGRRCAAGG